MSSVRRIVERFPLFNNKISINLIILLIFAGSLFFRFYNYSNRWGLASDQARDAIVATYALSTHVLPMTGPFSASGPFVFGPYMYWFLMAVGTLLPFSFFGYWIGLSVVSSLMVFPMILIGKEIKDTSTGLILGFFTAISPAQNNQATNLTASALAGFFSILSVYFFIRSLKYSSFKNFFLLGLFTGLAINTHFQGIPLVLLIVASGLLSRKIKNVLSTFLGFIIPFIPLIIFDLTNNFFESANILKYFLSNDSAALSGRWLTYLANTWPQFWRMMIGGNVYLSAGLIILTLFVFVYFLYKKTIEKSILVLGIIYALIFVILRYFPGQLFGDFTAFIGPFVLILVTWALIKIKDANVYLGLFLIILVSLFTVNTTFNNISLATNYSSINSKKLENILIQQFPKGSKFAIYDYKYQNTEVSLPLILYLTQDKKISNNGIKIGIAGSLIPNFQLNYFEKGRYTEFLYTLRGYPNDTLVKNGWVLVNPSNVYKSVENWYK